MAQPLSDLEGRWHAHTPDYSRSSRHVSAVHEGSVRASTRGPGTAALHQQQGELALVRRGAQGDHLIVQYKNRGSADSEPAQIAAVATVATVAAGVARASEVADAWERGAGA